MTTERDKDARDFDDGMEVSRLRAEVERLRAGLLKIATGGAQYPIGEAASLLFLDAPTPEPDVEQQLRQTGRLLQGLDKQVPEKSSVCTCAPHLDPMGCNNDACPRVIEQRRQRQANAQKSGGDQ